MHATLICWKIGRLLIPKASYPTVASGANDLGWHSHCRGEVPRGKGDVIATSDVVTSLLGLLIVVALNVDRGDPMELPLMSRLVSAAKKSIFANLRFLYFLVADGRDLMVPRMVALLSIVAFAVYTRSPYQLIPQNVPVFGYCDDLSILVFGFVAARRLTPRELIGFLDNGAVPRAVTELAREGQSAFAEPRSRPISLYDTLGYRHAWRIKSAISAHRHFESAPIVIGGCGRSGTTLLRTILSRHQEIACGEESTVFLRRISSPEHIGWRYGIDPDEISEMMRRSRSQAEFIVRFEATCLERSGKTIWAEKTPENVRRFGFIRRNFPAARLVHVIRDGRDVVCSLRRQRWFKVPETERSTMAAVEYAIDYWMERVEAGIRFRGDPLYHEIRYEDLIDDPTETLQALFDALGLDWEPSLLVAPGTEDDAPHQRPIYAFAVEQWRTELSPAEIALIERKAGPLLRSLGYPA